MVELHLHQTNCKLERKNVEKQGRGHVLTRNPDYTNWQMLEGAVFPPQKSRGRL